jgi:hypothetical protein
VRNITWSGRDAQQLSERCYIGMALRKVLGLFIEGGGFFLQNGTSPFLHNT